MATLQPKLANQQALALTIEKMQGVLKKSESDKNKLASDKEKLESYTKKALHNVQDKYMLAIQTIKEQLKEKDERIVRLTDQYKQFRHQSQREAQLMSSAIYEVGPYFLFFFCKLFVFSCESTHVSLLRFKPPSSVGHVHH